MLILKKNFKTKKYYFNIFLNKKQFKKLQLKHFKTAAQTCKRKAMPSLHCSMTLLVDNQADCITYPNL
jgi:hypothetical protein